MSTNGALIVTVLQRCHPRERESSPYITATPNEMDHELSTNSSMKDESGPDEIEDGLESVEPDDRSNHGDGDTATDQLRDNQ
jgi:hypothetical protein